MILSEQDIIDLTKKERPFAQAKQLDHLGITYKKRIDGSLVVSKSHVDKLLGGDYSANESTQEPNWTALENAQAA